ncbi:MAG: hypothetical protein WAL50_08010 [Kineosporiaceae bacterium]
MNENESTNPLEPALDDGTPISVAFQQLFDDVDVAVAAITSTEIEAGLAQLLANNPRPIYHESLEVAHEAPDGHHEDYPASAMVDVDLRVIRIHAEADEAARRLEDLEARTAVAIIELAEGREKLDDYTNTAVEQVDTMLTKAQNVLAEGETRLTVYTTKADAILTRAQDVLDHAEGLSSRLKDERTQMLGEAHRVLADARTMLQLVAAEETVARAERERQAVAFAAAYSSTLTAELRERLQRFEEQPSLETSPLDEKPFDWMIPRPHIDLRAPRDDDTLSLPKEEFENGDPYVDSSWSPRYPTEATQDHDHEQVAGPAYDRPGSGFGEELFAGTLLFCPPTVRESALELPIDRKVRKIPFWSVGVVISVMTILAVAIIVRHGASTWWLVWPACGVVLFVTVYVGDRIRSGAVAVHRKIKTMTASRDETPFHATVAS